MTNARDAVELAVRESYGRLVAYLTSRSGDVAAAEDSLGEAVVAALDTWPRDGVPDRPEAWLLTVARRRLIDDARHADVHADTIDALRVAMTVASTARAQADDPANASGFPDERLRLLFMCADPAVDPAARTPLMLQAVLGLDAARIASAFLVPPATMGQRLVRAKAKLRDAPAAIEPPTADEAPARVTAVLDAIYVAYGSGWDDVTGADPASRGLAAEALWLGRLVVRLLPDNAEALGLLSLMLHGEARRPTRRDDVGRYVPLDQQDASRWSRALMDEAEAALSAAARLGKLGRFQLEAAIQSVHAARAWTGRTDWDAVALLYEGLTLNWPSTGALVGRAAALGEARGVDAGLAALRAIDADVVSSYQPYWAVLAHLSRRAGNARTSADATARAIGLSEDVAVRAFLTEAGSVSPEGD